MQADSIVPEPGNPQSLNRYSYTLNNPLEYRDPSGHAAEAGAGIGDLEAWMRLLDQEHSTKFNGWLHERDAAWAALLLAKQEGMPSEVLSGMAAVLESKQTCLLINGYRGNQAAQRAAADAYSADVGQGVIGFAAGMTSLGAPALTNHPTYVGESGETNDRVVIGKTADLERAGELRPGERPLDLPDQGNPKRNWMQNSSKLRAAMRVGYPIRDASDPSQWNGPLQSVEGNADMNTYGGFLRAERELLMNHGWWYNSADSTWYPPGW